MTAHFKSREYDDQGNIEPRGMVEMNIETEHLMEDELLYCQESENYESLVVIATNRSQITVDNRKWKLKVM